MRFRFYVTVEAKDEREAWARYMHEVLLGPVAKMMADESPADVKQACIHAGVCKRVVEYGDRKVEEILGEEWIRTEAILDWANEQRREEHWGKGDEYREAIEDCMDDLEYLAEGCGE